MTELPVARAALAAWYEICKRDLPWRRTRDPYAIWISEIMLQQTRVAAVIPYYERFLALYPTVDALARASNQNFSRLGLASATTPARETSKPPRRRSLLSEPSPVIMRPSELCPASATTPPPPSPPSPSIFPTPSSTATSSASSPASPPNPVTFLSQ